MGFFGYISSNIRAALRNANAPSGANPFATIADLSGYINPIIVADYTFFPAPATVPGAWYLAENDSGWRVLFTFKSAGLYYSNGVKWIFPNQILPLTQLELDAGTEGEKYVNAITFNAAAKWNTKLDVATFDEQNQITKEPTGFPNRTDSTFSFDDGLREFTIQPVGVSFDIWTQGTKHIISTPQSITLPNVTGKYFIYFDDTPALGQTLTFDDSILNDKVLTATVYYNATTGKGEFVVDERHGLTMDWATHFHMHNAFGTRYYGGFGVAYTLGDGSADTHGQIALGGGTIADEDIPTTIIDDATPTNFFEQILSPIAKIPVVYKLTTGEWQKDVATDYAYKLDGGIPQYNLDTLGVHTLEDVTDGNYFAMWVFATPETTTPIIAIIGTTQDADLNDAKNNNTYGTIDWGDLPSQEYKVLYRLLFQYDTTFTNTNNVALADITDLRGSIDATLASGSLTPVSDHGNLIGLADDDHLQYHNDTRGDARYSQLGHTHVSADITDLVIAPKIKSGVITAGSFAGNPKKYILTFGTAFSDANYSVAITGIDERAWAVDAGQTASQVVINAKANAALTGNVYWTAIKHGEN